MGTDGVTLNMHDSVHQWARTIITKEFIYHRDVIDVGAMDVNGSLRDLVVSFEPASYTGYDIRSGPGVDQICPAESLPAEIADVVICTEMLKHAEKWREALLGLVRALRPGGLLVLTTRSPGFPRHDHPGDWWRFPVDFTRQVLTEGCGMTVITCVSDWEAPGVFALALKPSLVNFSAVPVE
jgi:SAM-dependent methyltransferase